MAGYEVTLLDHFDSDLDIGKRPMPVEESHEWVTGTSKE